MNPPGLGWQSLTPGGELLPPEKDPFLAPLRFHQEAFKRAYHMGYPRVGEDGRIVLGPWAERELYWAGGEGPCPPRHKVHTAPGRARLRVGVYSWSCRLGGRVHSRPPKADGERLRRSLRASDARLFRAATYLELALATPSHLLTLTIPVSTWNAIPREARPRVYARARQEFLRRLSQHVYRRLGFRPSFLRWDEFTKQGVPHLHAVLDLGGRLPQDLWEHLAREWIPEAWRRALQRAGLPVRRAPRTRLEALRHADMRYAKSYAVGKGLGGKKGYQHRLPFPGRWGRSWDVGGEWRALLREARWDDHFNPAVVRVELDPLDLLVLREALTEVRAPGYLQSHLLPVVQVAEVLETSIPAEDGLVLRRRVGGFFREVGHRKALLQAVGLLGIPPPSPPP